MLDPESSSGRQKEEKIVTCHAVTRASVRMGGVFLQAEACVTKKKAKKKPKRQKPLWLEKSAARTTPSKN